MRILIVGCGGVGGYFGGQLARAGGDVMFLARAQTASVLRRQGLELRWPDRSERISVGCVTVGDLHSAHKLPVFEYVWITVKCYDLAQALNDIAPIMRSGAPTIVTCQNGLGAEELILERYADAPLIGGVAYVSAERIASGVIGAQPGGSAAFGAWNAPAATMIGPWIAQWQQANLKVRQALDIRAAKWEKLCWNAVFNALTAGLRCPLGDVLRSPQLLEIGREAVREIQALAAAQGLELNQATLDTYFRDTGTLSSQYTSMYVDLEAGRPTEVDWINGAIVQRGEQAGIPTPLNRSLRTLVKMQERLRR